MVAMAKWLTHRIVIPAFEGSIPSSHPIFVCKLKNIYGVDRWLVRADQR